VTNEDRDIAELQLATADPDARVSEGAGRDKENRATVEFKGREFALADKVGAIAIMQLAATGDMSAEDAGGLAAMYFALEACVHEDDWNAWKAHARATKADGSEINEFLQLCLETIAGRPTKPRDGSSGGSSRTTGSSTGGSSSRRAKGSKR
jgi:hypothetical protein